MKKMLVFLLLLTAVTMSLHAQVTFADSASTTKSQKKIMQSAGRRVLAFYDWYVRFRKTNHAIPTSHAIIDQNTTARMKNTLADNRFEYDVFMANRFFDDSCSMQLVARKVEKDKITVQAMVKGKYTYTFHVYMTVQQDSWRIDSVVEDEDMKPADEDKG